MHRKGRHPLRRILVIVPLAILGIAAFGYVLMSLWNWLVPPIIGWKAIDYWQALGLFVLARILFGFGGGHRRHMQMHWRARMAERWERMTPEEREKFREGMRGRCGWREEAGGQ